MALTLILLARQHSADLKAITAANLHAQRIQLELLDKGMAMIRASDPWQYQQVQSMNQPSSLYDEDYDPSPESEARRIAVRDRHVEDMEEELNAEERAALSDIFPGF